MKLIVGLGNPGREYKKNRHNIGFRVLDRLAEDREVDFKRRKFNAKYAACSFEGQELLLVKPQTYMNLSGRAVRSFVAYFKIDIVEDVLIIVDDINLPFTSLRLRSQSSAGGHNGIQSVIDELGDNTFARIRLGVGMPPDEVALRSYVLSDFTASEQEKMPQLLDKARDATFSWIRSGVVETMQRYNAKSL
jgi:peptidyl-tRNA hydrolase, PTH1 family